MPYPEQFLKESIEAAAKIGTWPLFAPEGVAPPYAVYRRGATVRERYMDGQAGQPKADFEIEIYADGYIAVKELAEAIRIACDTFKGQAGALTIDDVQLTDERDGEPVFLEGRDKPTYMVAQTYSIRWTEPFPRS